MFHINIEVIFRLFNLDKYQAITLTREVTAATYKSSPKSDSLMGSVYLNENLDNLDELIIFFERQKVALQDCDILISATIANCENSVATPMFVNRILKHIDCQLTFSFDQAKAAESE